GRPRRADGCRKRLFTAAVFSSLPSTLTGITCPTPTSVEHAGIRVKSYSVHSRERYVCNSGFKRKAGTSSLTQCMFNETTQTAHWTAPNLKCIRDPSLTHQRPVPFSTATTARVTLQPESPSPSGKASSPGADTTVAAETAVAPHSPSKPPSAGPPGPGGQESSQAPSQTTAVGTSEGTPSAPRQPPGQLSLFCAGGARAAGAADLEKRPGAVAHACHPGTLGGQGGMIALGQEFETSLSKSEIPSPRLY
uniref:Interleukin-15 receptor subunit alpha n=1 Tax=Microcebus murinus TaxID=30608 RepID=A0A8C5YER4_MICMU